MTMTTTNPPYPRYSQDDALDLKLAMATFRTIRLRRVHDDCYHSYQLNMRLSKNDLIKIIQRKNSTFTFDLGSYELTSRLLKDLVHHAIESKPYSDALFIDILKNPLYDPLKFLTQGEISSHR